MSEFQEDPLSQLSLRRLAKAIEAVTDEMVAHLRSGHATPEEIVAAKTWATELLDTCRLIEEKLAEAGPD